MPAKLRRHLTYANVVSSICLFVLLGGSAYAAVKIGSKQIKDNSIQSRDIKNNQVAGKDVRNRSLTGSDFKAGQLPAGPRGAAGQTGARGESGPAGAPAASLLTGRFNENFGDVYAAPSGISTSDPTTESKVSTLSPAQTIVARDLFVRSVTGGSSAKEYRLRVNGIDSALRCTISATPGSGGTPAACSDATHTASIPAGSDISIHFVYSSSGGTTPPDARFGWRATTP